MIDCFINAVINCGSCYVYRQSTDVTGDPGKTSYVASGKTVFSVLAGAARQPLFSVILPRSISLTITDHLSPPLDNMR